MKRVVLPVVACVAVFVVMFSVAAPKAFALRQFKAQFEKRYVKPDSTDTQDVAFRESCQEAGCSICHFGKERSHRNEYGKALAKLLNKKDKDADEKIQQSLEKVESLKINPADAKSPTFGERLKEGKLPVEVKKSDAGR